MGWIASACGATDLANSGVHAWASCPFKDWRRLPVPPHRISPSGSTG